MALSSKGGGKTGLNTKLNSSRLSPKLQPPCPAITLEDVQVHYATQGPLVLDLEHLAISQGDRVAIIGSSGSGKTTLLRLINGYVRPETGQMTVLGGKISSNTTRRRDIRRRIGFVFQNFNLIERATVFDNVLWGRLGWVNPSLSLMGWFSEADKEAAMRAIEEVDLLEQIDQRADTLSGGQEQRVAVARVLAQGAEIILADEPVSNLDPALADDILGLLSEVSERHGATLIMSVHQPKLAKRYADRIIGLSGGRVIYDDAAAALNSSAIRKIYGREVDLDSAPTTLPISKRGNEVILRA